jgi:hypothetical protein
MKNLKKILGGLALVLLVAGCADVLQGPAAPEAKPGKVTLSVSAGPARTVAPAMSQFKKIVLSIEDSDEAVREVPVDSSGSATVEFQEPGSWKITAKAYIDAEDPEPAAESDPHDFSWDDYGAEVNGETSFVLKPTAEADAPGHLQYRITIPQDPFALAATGSSITIAQEDGAKLGLEGFTDNERGITAGETNTVSLSAGRYWVEILLVENEEGNTAVYWENVVILPGLLTEISFAPAAGDFLDPGAWAALTDINEKDGEENNLLAFDETTLNAGGVVVSQDFSNPASPALAIAAPAGSEAVRFTLAKTAQHSVAVSGGTGAAAVTALEAGAAVEGSEAGEDLAVFTVDTSDLKDTGGDVTFTLAIAKEGKLGVNVEVTVTVAAPQTAAGQGLYIDSGVEGTESLAAVEGFDYNGADSGLLQAALNWLATEAVNDTKYVVLLGEDSALETPFCSKQDSEGVKITLRGLEEEREVYWNSVEEPETDHDNSQGTKALSGIFVVNAGTTLVLGEKVLLGSSSDSEYLDLENSFAVNIPGGVFEMLAGSKISRISGSVIVFVPGGGTFMMSGGSIKNNKITGSSNDTRNFF